MAPVAMAAIYFGSFSLGSQNVSLSRQALFKLSFLHRHFLQPDGLKVSVDQHVAVLAGNLNNPLLAVLAGLLARQIEGIFQIKDETVSPPEVDTSRESVRLLFASDQTLRSGVHISGERDRLTLEGEVHTLSQKSWAEQLAEMISPKVVSKLQISTFTPAPFLPLAEPPHLDDESLQALVLFRLQLGVAADPASLRVKATRGVVTIQGKVETEALRQRAENLARSTLGIRELRSSLALAK